MRRQCAWCGLGMGLTEPVEDQHRQLGVLAELVTLRAIDAVNAQGDRLKGVTVYLLSGNGLEAVVASTKTDDNGHYEFRDAPLPIRRF